MSSLELSKDHLANIHKIIRDGYFHQIIFGVFLISFCWCIYYIFTIEMTAAKAAGIFVMLVFSSLGMGFSRKKVRQNLTKIESILKGKLN